MRGLLPQPPALTCFSLLHAEAMDPVFLLSVVYFAQSAPLPLALGDSGGLCSWLSSSHVSNSQFRCGTDAAEVQLSDDVQSELGEELSVWGCRV